MEIIPPLLLALALVGGPFLWDYWRDHRRKSC